jgi:hypothetical protein
MNLIGSKVIDSITGLRGTVLAQAQYLHDNELVLITCGAGFDSAWISAARVQPLPLTDAAPATLKTEPVAKAAAAAAKPANGAATNGAAPAAAVLAGAAPASAAVSTVYAEVASAFMTLGKAGMGSTILAILKSHGATHAKELSDNAPALADVLAQAKAAVAAMPRA